MTERKRFMPAPRGIHPDTLRDPRHSILDKSGTHLITYCPRHAAGAFYNEAGNLWTIWMPIDFATFMAVLQGAGLLINDNDELATWIEACSPAAVPPSQYAH